MIEAATSEVQAIIVDDDKAIRFLHELRVRQSGIARRISKFSSARDAFNYLNAQGANVVPCIIFLDINMPEMNGWDFLRLLEASSMHDGIYVVMVSSSIQKVDREKAQQFPHVVHFLEKPLNRQLIEEARKVDKLRHLFTRK